MVKKHDVPNVGHSKTNVMKETWGQPKPNRYFAPNIVHACSHNSFFENKNSVSACKTVTPATKTSGSLIVCVCSYVSYVLMCFICFQPTVATTTYVLNGFHMCPTIHVKNNNCFYMFPTKHVQHNMCTHVFICFNLLLPNHVKTNMYVHICFICFHMFPTNHVRRNIVS